MSDFTKLTGINDNDQFTPSQKWQIAGHFVELAEKRLKELRALEAELQKLVIDQFDALEITKVKNPAFCAYKEFCPDCTLPLDQCDDSFNEITIFAATVYQALQTHARLTSDKPETFAALRFAGLGDKIKQTINPSDLSAWYRKQLEENSAFKLPDILTGCITISQYYDLRQRNL